MILLHIKDPKDVLPVADALLKSGYTVVLKKQKVNGKYENVVAAKLQGEQKEGEAE
mgnify:CR=1 FL=1